MTVLLLAGVLGACAIRDVSPPAVSPAPAAFKEPQAIASATRPARAGDDWWQAFEDPALDALQRRLVQDNQNLRAAAARVAAARATVDAQLARSRPTLDLDASASRGDSSSAARSTTSSFGLAGAAQWELDLWGRLGRAADIARSGHAASVADAAALRLSTEGTLVQTYVQMRAAEQQQALLAGSVEAYRRSLELTRARYDAGVVGRADVLQAKTQLASAEVALADQQSVRAQLEHAIAVLVGVPPSSLDIAPAARLPALPQVPAAVPAELLTRRPDIAAARERVLAAYAQIGLADSADLPSLVLSASAGTRSAELARLLSAPSAVWSLGASLAARLVDGGARDAATAQARAAAQEAVANYRQRVLQALAEVEDGLIAASRLATQADRQQDALDSARQALAIVEAQYSAGTVSFLNVVIAQNTVLSTERAMLDLQSRRLQAVAGLLKNLAGNWEPVRPPG